MRVLSYPYKIGLVGLNISMRDSLSVRECITLRIEGIHRRSGEPPTCAHLALQCTLSGGAAKAISSAAAFAKPAPPMLNKCAISSSGGESESHCTASFHG